MFVILLIGMRIKFLKDVTVDVIEPWSGTNDTIEKLMRRGETVDCNEIQDVSKSFSNVWTNSGDCLVSIRNDWFEVLR